MCVNNLSVKRGAEFTRRKTQRLCPGKEGTLLFLLNQPVACMSSAASESRSGVVSTLNQEDTSL